MPLTIYRGKHGTRYGYRFRFHGRVYQDMVGHTRTLAHEAEKRERAKLELGSFESRWGPLQPRKTPWEECIKRYLDAKADKRTLAQDRQRLGWWGAFFATQNITSIQAVSPEVIDKGKVALRAAGMAEATVKGYLAPLRSLCHLAIRRWKILSENPTALIDWPRAAEREPNLPTRAQLEALLEKAGPTLAACILVAVQTGLRKASILGIRREDLDAQAGMLRVIQKGNRILMLPLTASLRAFLLARAGKDGRIFPKRMYERGWRKVRAEVGLPDLRFHDLRHLAGTLLAEGGVQERVIQAYLGHATIQMTQRYTHPRAPALREAADLLSRAVQPAPKYKKSRKSV